MARFLYIAMYEPVSPGTPGTLAVKVVKCSEFQIKDNVCLSCQASLDAGLPPPPISDPSTFVSKYPPRPLVEGWVAPNLQFCYRKGRE